MRSCVRVFVRTLVGAFVNSRVCVFLCLGLYLKVMFLFLNVRLTFCLILSGSEGLLKLWTIKTNECVKTFDQHLDKVSGICYFFRLLYFLLVLVCVIYLLINTEFSKGWFTLATESEAESESEAQGALRSSVNQKTESEAESEARRNRSQKDQKSFFFFRFRFRFRRFRSSENKVNGIGSGSGIISQSKNSLPVPFKLRTSL